jgi:acyl-[acyl-carrier-protein]-phospholipid O-acyltransferase/long-chain-fatty-acid--[acyl-carrier-protein] ligase
MVPHGRVEEALQQAAGVAQQVFAVTAVPDERKGERLVVLHTLDPAAIPDVLAKVQASGLPNLFIPRADQFIRIERLPLLGTGKLDLRELRRLAAAGSGNMA